MRSFLKTTVSCFVLYLSIGLASSQAYTQAYAFDEEKCKVVQAKACVDFGKRMVDGIESKDECWKYEEQHYCLAKEKNDCSELEANSGCNEISGKCLEQSDIGLCKDLEKKFKFAKMFCVVYLC